MIALLALLLVHFSPHGGCEAEAIYRIAHAKQSVHIQAYSFTSRPIIDACAAAQARGVIPVIILDDGWLKSSPESADRIRNAGLAAKIDAKHCIAHNKVIIIDARIVLTGSFNPTGQAERCNAENLVTISDKKIAKQFEDNFAAHLAHSQ